MSSALFLRAETAERRSLGFWPGGAKEATRDNHIRTALGHSLQKRDVRATSGFHLIATEERTSRDVSNVP